MKLNLNPEHLAQITGGIWNNTPCEGNIDHLIIDSRRSFDPSKTVFLALKGKKTDGHQYIDELYKKGVRWFIVTKDFRDKYAEACFLKIDDAVEALQKIATYHRKKFNYPVVGITGSNGKTIVKEWLYDLVRNDFTVIRSPKSYNSQIGVPLSVLEMTEDHSLAIFEAGISKPGEMAVLQQIIEPTIGVFTHLGTAHVENFENRAALYKEKSTLFVNCETVVAPEAFAQYLQGEQNIVCWDRSQNNHNYTVENHHIQFQFNGNKYSLKLIQNDNATVENTLAAVHGAIVLGADKKNIEKNAEELETPALRLEVLDGKNNCQLINDTYNNDFSGLTSAVDFHKQQPFNSHVLVLSEMAGLNQNERDLVNWINQLDYLDEIIFVGARFKSVLPQIKTQQKQVVGDVKELLSLHKVWSNTSILVKGSRSHQLEKFSFSYSATPHEAVLNINLEAIRNNLNYFRELIDPKVKVMAMVKASAYGGGIEKMGAFLQHESIDALGVAYVNEGVQLRTSGIDIPIMVLNPSPNEYNLMIQHQLEPAIGSLERLDGFIKALIVENIQNYPIHIELESGMHRLGVAENELNVLIEILKAQPEVSVASVFSHLAASEDPNEKPFTQKQIRLFDSMSNSIQEHFSYSFSRHICNSQGVINFPQAHFDLVRLGLGLYGYGHRSLEPAFSMHASVSQVKTIQAGDTVSYGRSFKAKHEMKLAVVSIGYADGLRKALSNNKWSLLWKGNPLPIVGQICMDMCMVDASGHAIKEGDSVQVFGPGNELVEMAAQLETIPYEILTGISNRIMRVYES